MGPKNITYDVTEVTCNESAPNDETLIKSFDNVKDAIVCCDEQYEKEGPPLHNTDYVILVNWE